MLTRLPEHWDPRQIADLGESFTGHLKLADMPRLSGLLADSAGRVDYSLTFAHDEFGRVVIEGELRTTLTLQCQRCLGSFGHDVVSRVSLVLVEGLDEAERLPDRYDPLLPEKHRVSTREFIEDELLLALPQVPMHPRQGCCSPDLDAAAANSGEGAQSNPFSLLAKLKQESHQH